MKFKDAAEVGFSSVFFDTLFGLVLFFGLDSFLEISSRAHLVFYISATIILVHWWLLFKSADDAFGEDVDDSAIDLCFGIIEVILINYIMLLSKEFAYQAVAAYLVALLAIDLVWALAWRHAGAWRSQSAERITAMERTLTRTAMTDIAGIVAFLALLFFSSEMSAALYVGVFLALYIGYIVLTFRNKIINLRVF